MKTLVVLSALAAVALAAPALLEGKSEDLQKTITKLPLLTREKKSPEETHDSQTPAATQGNSQHVSEFGASARTIVVKRPIIIKKNEGYHVYRDSDEEPAQSGEICGKQVKVKLCDKSDALRSTTIDDLKQMTEDEMKHNIKLAKDAVENLQRDLSKIEKTPGAKAVPWQHGQTDRELHQDIEVAREALEHIHKNFGNLESMSLMEVTDSKALKSKDWALTKTEEERIAQWNRAMQAIQRNTEIARNIEDSFRDQTLTGLDFSDTMIDGSKNLNNDEQEMRTSSGHHCLDENSDCKDKSKLHENKINDLNKNTGAKDDMASSASTGSESKMNLHEMQKSGPLEPIKNHNLQTPKEKSAATDLVMIENVLQKNNPLSSDSMKVNQEGHAKSTNQENKLENTDSFDSSINKMKSTESDSKTDQGVQIKQDHIMKLQTKDLLPEDRHPEITAAKNFEVHNDIKNDNMQADKQHTRQFQKMAPLVKASEFKPADWQKDLKHEKPITDEHLAHHTKMSHMQDSLHQTEPMMVPTPHWDKQHHLQAFLHPEMKSVDEMKMQHFAADPFKARGDAEHLNFQSQMMKSANGIHAQSMNHDEKTHLASHHLHHAVNSHQFNVHGHHVRHPEVMAHGKSADNMGMQMYYMGPDNQLFRWKPSHEMPTMRNTYGAPAPPVASGAGNGGALAVFPNANLGNVAIPLLLSCNPSVTQGNISKHSSSYTAPAYRSEDDGDMNFHMKRDVKKTQENELTSLHKTPASNFKTGTVLVAKQ